MARDSRYDRDSLGCLAVGVSGLGWLPRTPCPLCVPELWRQVGAQLRAGWPYMAFVACLTRQPRNHRLTAALYPTLPNPTRQHNGWYGLGSELPVRLGGVELVKEYRFNVLCHDEDSCKKVMADMEKHYSVPAKRIRGPKDTIDSGDHFIKLKFDGITAADKVGQDMIKRYAELVRTISLIPPRKLKPPRKMKRSLWSILPLPFRH